MGNTIRYLFLGIFILSGMMVTGQKIKYKDLFPLLDAKNYEQAEPQLRIFLSNEKNVDEANAHYQFAVIMEKYFMEGDIILDTANTLLIGDTAVAFYGLAKNLIDEKELKKNDEYYQSFYRRDLRTGKFGIKISDVHLDIEKKIEAIVNRQDQIRNLHLMLSSIKETEKSLVAAYNDLFNRFDSYTDFILRAEMEEISSLGILSDLQFSVIDKSKEIAELAKVLGIGDQYQSLEFLDLPGKFESIEEVMTTLDGSLEVHSVDDWAMSTKQLINGDIGFLKRLMISTDEELSTAQGKLLESDGRVRFPEEIPTDLVRLSEVYDPQNGPLGLINARISENIILKLADTVINTDWKDSLLIAYHVETCDSIVGHLQNIGALLPDLKSKLEASTTYYSNYLSERYDGLDGALAYVDQLSVWAESQTIKWDTISGYWNLMNDYGISGNDTIPLNPSDSTYEGDFYTLNNWKIGDYDMITYGVKKDSLIGFVARFGADRRVKWETRFESSLFEENFVREFRQDTLLSAEDDITFYLYDSLATDTENMTIVSFNTEDGMTYWNVDIKAEKKPVYSTFSPSIKQYTIFYYPQEAYPLADGRLGYIVIDRNGELR